MPGYDDAFLLHCAKMEKRGSRSYAPHRPQTQQQPPKWRRFKWLPSAAVHQVPNNNASPQLMRQLMSTIAEISE